MALLAGKHAVVFGFASHRSIAWAIAQGWHAAGATVALGIQNERFRPAAEKCTSGWSSRPLIFTCDVSNDDDIRNGVQQVAGHFNGRLHCLLHSIAFATQHAMKSPFLETTRDDFRIAHDVSAYSLIALAREANPLLSAAEGASITTLSYIGSQRVVPNYKIMSAAKASLEACTRLLAVEMGPKRIRVNAISAGPIDTLAARGIPGFTTMREAAAAKSPLGRGVTPDDVAGMATFLASDAGAGTTGQTLLVDAGCTLAV